MDSTVWAGESKPNKSRQATGEHKPLNSHLRLGFSSESNSYAISFSRPDYDPSSESMFLLDPGIIRESIWPGGSYRPQNAIVERKNSMVKVRAGRSWQVVPQSIPSFESMFDSISDFETTPEVYQLKERMRKWRFYDHFRTDLASPARLPQLGSRSPVLNNDGSNLAAAIQTINEIGDPDLLNTSIDEAFPGASIAIRRSNEGLFYLEFFQNGLLRPLTASELSEGTLRYLLLIAALLTPRPPELMVLNEPENSLHPDLIPALANLIVHASENSQMWVVSHSEKLVNHIERLTFCNSLRLSKHFGQTQPPDLNQFDIPIWHWPS